MAKPEAADECNGSRRPKENNNGLTILNDPSLAYTDTEGSGMTM